MIRGGRRLGVVVLTGLALAACSEWEPDPNAGPSPLPSVRVVAVHVEYRQPNACNNDPVHCDDRVVFFGSWMHPGDEVLLMMAPGTRQWSGVVPNVPVNFPPKDYPHLVRVFDPHLTQTATGGITAARLIVGDQPITVYDQPGTPNESGLIFIDENGEGHSPQ